MAKHRLPKDRAFISGADTRNPQRFKGRAAIKERRPLGDPPATMPEGQQAYWRECQHNMPWLYSTHRILLRLACSLAARMDKSEPMGINAMQALSSVLSKLGATPVDESRVNHSEEPGNDPTDRFFN